MSEAISVDFSSSSMMTTTIDVWSWSNVTMSNVAVVVAVQSLVQQSHMLEQFLASVLVWISQEQVN